VLVLLRLVASSLGIANEQEISPVVVMVHARPLRTRLWNGPRMNVFDTNVPAVQNSLAVRTTPFLDRQEAVADCIVHIPDPTRIPWSIRIEFSEMLEL
jgi:hypothetical protein